MTENDKKLIVKAESMHYRDWDLIDKLAEQAETQECKDRLLKIASFKYHKEEYHSGLL